MKKLLTIVICLYCLPAKTQMCPCEFGSKGGTSTLRHEIGLNALNVNEVMMNFYNPGTVYATNYANGFMYKYHADKWSLRAGFDYLEHSYQYQASSSKGFDNNKGKFFSKDFRLGAENTVSSTAVQIFVGADLVYSTARYSGISIGQWDSAAPYHIAYGINVQSFGAAPALGIKYRPAKHISITAETGISVLRYKSSETPGFPSESNVAVLFNPLRVLSLNYHF